VTIFDFTATINFIQLVYSPSLQIKVDLSKLATLRRVQCVLTGSVVTHSVLVCLMHQGTIPTIVRTRKPHKEKKALLIKAYHVCIARFLRNPAQPSPCME